MVPQRRLDTPAGREGPQQLLLPLDLLLAEAAPDLLEVGLGFAREHGREAMPRRHPAIDLAGGEMVDQPDPGLAMPGSASTAPRMSSAIRKAKFAEHQKVGSRNTISTSGPSK